MNSFRNLPIQQKMLDMTLIICGAVLLVATAALFTFQVENFRSNFQRNTVTLAAIIANNSTAAMAFEDAKAGNEAIGSLIANPDVVGACLVAPDGSVFAQFGKPEQGGALAEFPAAGESIFAGGQILCTQTIELNRKKIGSLYLRVDCRQTFEELIGFYAMITLGVVVVSLCVAIFLSNRLRWIITEPVLQLAETARMVGEKNDYSARVPVSGRTDELGRLTESFNQMLDRIQSQDAALNLSQQKMETLVNSIDGIVWEWNPRNSMFTFVSPQSRRILGYPPERWIGAPDFWDKIVHPDDRERVAKACAEATAGQEPYSYEYRMIAADQRLVWIHESGVVQVDHGQPVSFRGIFIDITERKESTDKLDKLNRQLIETSRLAGMAEVATGVLHNVGNVLNSVSVSATLVGEHLQRSKIGNLRRATTILWQKNGQLAEFLTTDPKGKLLPEYLKTVADQLADEQAQLVAEMGSVRQHIEHIKEIVAMQQNYAKVSGAFEDLPAASLVEDALQMNAAAFERHNVRVIREIDQNAPAVRVDRHKVLQILINLIRNAKYAMDAQSPQEKQLLIRVEVPTIDRVRVIVRDNGVGILPDNLVKIFNHGFTTKKNGHGFGLHSGANAAKEMGGSLAVQSSGVGQGASFILELPVAAARKETASTEKVL